MQSGLLDFLYFLGAAKGGFGILFHDLISLGCWFLMFLYGAVSSLSVYVVCWVMI